MKKELKKKINSLANLMYKLQGYQQDQDYDFSKAYHPQEKMCWNMALVSHCFWSGDMSMLKHQV